MRPRPARPGRNLGVWPLPTLIVAISLLAFPGWAEQPNAPPYYAIRNARIVPVSGPVIENGTLVIANGVIAAVGANVSIPPEAWVIDGRGLTVYPGLIDALTNLGLPAPPTPTTGAQAAQQAQQAPVSMGPEDRPGTTPWENAADQLSLSDNRLATWRKAGFISVVTAPERGIFPGQAALINTAGERPRDLVVKTPAALRLNLTGGAAAGVRGFPGSLMGVLAYIKQVFLDAQQAGQALAVYAAEPKGLERPTYDRSLEPIRAAISSRWPVLLPATWAREIHRALALGEDIRASTVIYGAHQGYAVAEALAAKKVPVLVSLKWPEKPRDADPEAEEPLRVLRFRDRAPSTPAAFAKAGVKFAFYSDGLGDPKQLLKNAKKAIDAGLAADGALRALTLSAAEIYGVADRLGSLDVGKIANLVLTDGDIFEEKTKVKIVFVDGRKYEIREPGRPTEPPSVNLTGKWTLSVTGRQGTQESTLDLKMAEDGALSGTLTSRQGTFSITSGWVSGNQFSFTLSIAMGPRTVEATYSGTVEGDQMTGTARLGPVAAEFTGKRAPGGGNQASSLSSN